MLATGCALAVVDPAERLLEPAGWTRAVVAAGEFELSWFSGSLPADTPQLHVYLGGDGRAFVSRRRVAHDPTGSEHLALQLALADPAPSALLARPCYYGGALAPPCEPALWTVDRYGPRVVSALVAALAEIGERYPRARLTLIGYSGGGVVALLAARHVARVERVVTIAAPLDTAAWTQHHGYTRLGAASNPAAFGEWRDGLTQVHLVGVDDVTVPASIAASFHHRTGLASPRSVTVPFAGHDHQCCWLDVWPAILASLAARDGFQPSRK